MKKHDSSWAEVGGQSQQKSKEEEAVEQSKERERIRSRDKIKEDLVAKYNEKYRSNSLLNSHEEKLKQKGDSSDKKIKIGATMEWKAWDRDSELAAKYASPLLPRAKFL